jgi:predicted HicB family RNase H-like nuclease
MSKRKLNKQLTIRITSKEHKMLKKRAAAENEPSVSALLRRVLKTYLKEHP